MRPSIGQRILSLSAGIALNLAALAMLIWLRGPVPSKGQDPGGSVISVSLASAPVTTNRLPMAVSKLRRQNFARLAVPAEPASTAASPDGTSTDCPIAEDIAKGIVADPVALDAILHAPAEIRSVADAIVVWNLVWAPAAADLQSPLGSVRSNVMATLRSASEDCLSPIVSGPRLIAIPDGERTMILVFGSGDWSWQSLVEPDLDDQHPSDEQGVAADALTSRDWFDKFEATLPVSWRNLGEF